jgi:Fic family protein
MREHLKAIDHQQAIAYVKYLIEKKEVFNEHTLLAVHHLILRYIIQPNAGKYRQV